jgi:peptide/nickel transport system substrate-binding protein
MRLRGRRWLFLLILTAGIASFSALWYASDRETKGNQAAFGGAYVEGLTGAPSRINPLFGGQNAVDASMASLIFSGLTRLDDKGQPFPDLAESWDLSPDSRAYTFRLRHGVVWQDGAPFSADDVLYTFAALNSGALRSPPGLAQVLAGATVSKVDALTVRLELSQPYAPLLAYLSLGILPEHLLGQTPPAALFDADFNLKPVGTGPYRLDSLAPDKAVLVVNPAYHLGQPYIQRLELRFFRDDGALMTAVRAKEVDGAFFAGGVSSGDYFYLRGRTDLRLSQLNSGEVTFVYLNLKDPLFQDRRVRQALTYALDRDGLVQEELAGQSPKAASPLAEGTWAFTPSLDRYGTDPKVAAALLDDAGWHVAAGGVRSNGVRTLSFSLATNSDPVRVAVAQALAARWKDIGVEVKVEAGGTTTLVRDLLEPRAYQAALFAYRADVDPDPYPAWHSSQTGQGGRNISSLTDPRFDKLLEDARQSPDPARRTDLYHQFQELFAQEVPAIPLYASASLYVQRSVVQGVRVGYLDNPGARFWQVQDWYLKTR